MIIGIAGRMRSGKTELAKVCERFGYQRMSFATPLKNLCCSILGVSKDELNRLKADGYELNLTLDEGLCEMISSETEIPLQDVRDTCLGVTIENVRHMLQFIGTDLIREYNKDWHVNRLRSMLEEGKDYVFDDVRFPNEKKMIEDLGGDCWFVTRTTLDNITNHESETSLTWHTCWDKIIVNDSTLEYLLFKWSSFVENYDKSIALRKERLNESLEHCIKDEITALSTLDMLMISEAMYTYVPPTTFDRVRSASMNEDGSVVVKYDDGSLGFIDNQLAIEDLKMYL